METYHTNIFNSLIAIVSGNLTLSNILKEQCSLYGFSNVQVLHDWDHLLHTLSHTIPDIIVSDQVPFWNNGQIREKLESQITYYDSLPVILYSSKPESSLVPIPDGLTVIADLHGRDEQHRLLEVIHEELKKTSFDIDKSSQIPRTTHLNILVVTTDTALSSTIRTTLQKEGYYISIVKNIQDVMTYIQGISPHIVLLDYTIPHLKSLTLFQWIRNAYPHVVVMIMGDSRNPELESKRLEVGIKHYLSKPFDVNRLPGLFREALRDAERQSSPPILAGQGKQEDEQELENLRRLKESEENFRTLVNASGDIVFRITPQGILNFASPAVEEQLGYTREDIAEEHINVGKFVHAHDLIRVMAGIRQVIRGESIKGLEGRLMHKDKIHFRWYSINCYPMYNSQKQFVGVGGIARDIASIKEIEERIQKQNERLSALNAIAGIVSQSLNLDHISNKVVKKVLEIMRFRAGSICLVHSETQQFSLHSSQFARAENDKHHCIDDALLETLSLCKSLKQAMLETVMPVVVEDIFHHPDLSETSLVDLGFQTLVSVPLNSKEVLLGVMLLLVEEKRPVAQEDLQLLMSIGNQIGMAIENITLYQQEFKARERLEELNKLKDDFVAIVSHDLRSPLTAILGASEILLHDEYMDTPLTEDQRELVENIQTMGEQQLHLVNDLLDLAKIESGKLELKPTVANMSQILQQCHTTLKVLADNKNITLSLTIGPRLPKIMIDVPKISQVINNLVGNAIKFTEPGGKVTVQLVRDDDMVKISVTDTGEGIRPEDLLVLFNKFQQVKTRGTTGERGTGLGLSICKDLVELHKGTIWAESRVGVGSTFSFTLPITENVIVIIDDSLFVVKSLQNMLLEHIDHIKVKSANSGNEGLKLVEEVSPVVVILDYMLPDMNGTDVYRAMRKRFGSKTPPALFLTASQDLDVRREIFDLGAADYLQKPVDINDLLPRLSRILALDFGKKYT